MIRTNNAVEILPVSFSASRTAPRMGCFTKPPARITPCAGNFPRATIVHKTCEPYDSPSSQPRVIPLCASGVFEGRRVIVRRPRERARVGDFDEARPAADDLAKAADERPIAVQAGQINERGQRSFAVDAQLKFLVHRYGDYP